MTKIKLKIDVCFHGEFMQTSFFCSIFVSIQNARILSPVFFFFFFKHLFFFPLRDFHLAITKSVHHRDKLNNATYYKSLHC